MKLYVIRHAKASDFGDSAGKRALTKSGIEQSVAIGSYFKSNRIKPEIVLTSPVLRAHQTAEILCENGGIATPVICPWLKCGMSVEQAVSELKVYSDFSSLAIVGHNPDLYFLLHYLLDQCSAPSGVKKASVTVLNECNPSMATARLMEVLHF